MIKLKKIVATALLSILTLALSGQEVHYERNYPIVGDTIADHTFTDILNFGKQQVKISDFKGKWLILDYWSEGCSGCLKSFPKMNALHEQFKDQLQIIMVGIYREKQIVDEKIYDSERRTKGIYKVLADEHSLMLPVAFDSVLNNRHDVGALPHLLIIDPDGVLQAKTVSVNATQLKQLLAGKKVDFELAFSKTEYEEARLFYNEDIPVLTSGDLANGGVDTMFYYRSLLAPFQKKHTTFRNISFNFERERLKNLQDKETKDFRIELRGITRESFYLAAFFGNTYWEAYDTLQQKFSKQIKLELPAGEVNPFMDRERYTYSLTVPKSKASKNYILRFMQSDLERFFGYKAQIKKISMPVVYLKIRNKKLVEKLRNSSGIDSYKNADVVWQGFSETNVTMKSFIVSVSSWAEGVYNLPVYDKTGIKYNMDITINANLLDPKNGVKELERLGFKLVKGRKKLETIVISR
ncbi:TlpA family protein disulfide reductase [Sphingobacterium siyangense]|uniref:TlpA family protein disulfide reductase n=1 Tax=Sphingobacterium siyangense TaxID=459529 RepID=UPI0019636594|nr:TlpA disulfide reductase family protein [Sphingobacterium siyangense]QRY55564.1 TlpA family protein disulfide reductase [Sphingobacterium siyangense]